MSKQFNTKMVTKANENIRGSYVNIFQPRLNDLNGKMEYSMQLLIPKKATETIQLIANATKEAARKKWGSNVPKKYRKPLRDGDGETEQGEAWPAEYHGHWFTNISNDRPPGIVDQNRIPIDDATQLVSGDYVRVSVNAYGYEVKGNTGVSLGLVNVQLVRKGEPLGNTSRPEDDFDEIIDDASEGGGDDLDSMFDDDDDIPY